MEIENKSRSKWVLNAGGKSLFALIPALVATYFSFREAKLQSDIEIARINAKAGAGYEALADAVKTLGVQRVANEEESKRLAAYVSRLEVRIDGVMVRIGSRGVRMEPPRSEPEHSPAPPSTSPSTPSSAPAPIPTAALLVSPDKLFKAQQKSIKLPATLEDAYRAKK